MDLKREGHIGHLVLLALKGELNETERQELEEWRKSSASHEEIFQRMLSRAHLEEGIRRFVKGKEEQDKEWELICRRTIRKNRRLSHRFWRYAVLWILPLLLGGGIFCVLKNGEWRRQETVSVAFQPGQPHAILELADGTRINLKDLTADSQEKRQGWSVSHDSLKYRDGQGEQTGEYHTLRIPRGGEYTLILSDGTRVFLNAESRLKYPVNFSSDIRKVELEGEAYFEVHRDSLHPFIVEAREVQVNVLGTSFGVRAYPDEERILTTLVKGKVNMVADGRLLVLRPEEQAVFDLKSNDLTLATVNTELFVGWKDGRLVFDNCPLEHILKDLGRWYSFDVFYADPIVKKVPFSLNIRKHEKFAEVLELMQETGKVNFNINGNTVVVK